MSYNLTLFLIMFANFWTTSPCRRTFGDGAKNRLVRFRWSNKMCSFSRMYCESSGETSSPNSDWLSRQI